MKPNGDSRLVFFWGTERAVCCRFSTNSVLLVSRSVHQKSPDNLMEERATSALASGQNRFGYGLKWREGLAWCVSVVTENIGNNCRVSRAFSSCADAMGSVEVVCAPQNVPS